MGDNRWRDNWRLVAPDASACIDVGRSRLHRRAAARVVLSLPAGNRLILRAAAPGAHRRCRRLVTDLGLETERTFLTFPSARAPAYLVERRAAPLTFFTASVLTTPPRAPLAGAVDLLLELLRRLGSWRLLAALSPGCVMVVRRS